MGKKFTLDNIRAAAEEKYADVDIDGVVLLNALRLDKASRKELGKLQDRMTPEEDDEGNVIEDVDQVAVFEDAILTVAKSRADARRLLEEIDGDLTVLVEIFNIYASGTQAGEASASQD